MTSEARLSLAFALDPATVMVAGGLRPDPWQEGLLRSRGDALLCCSRQAGKSTASAALALSVRDIVLQNV